MNIINMMVFRYARMKINTGWFLKLFQIHFAKTVHVIFFKINGLKSNIQVYCIQFMLFFRKVGNRNSNSRSGVQLLEWVRKDGREYGFT